MDWAGSSDVIRLGPLARWLLARRRRWLRGVAIALAGLTILAAAAQLRRHAPPRRRAASIVVTHARISARRRYGVAAQVPPGMRAVKLLVPAGAAFAGEMPPRTRVDLLAAFDAGRERVVRQVLASGIVLGDSAPPSPGGRFGAAPVAQISVAIPARREREVAMAQAFGRLFVMVRPPARDAASAAHAITAPQRVRAQPSSETAAALTLSRYLGLPEARAAARVASVTGGWFPAGGPGWATGVRPPSLPATPIAHRRHGGAKESTPRYAGWTVEVIEGTTRSVAVVPQEGAR